MVAVAGLPYPITIEAGALARVPQIARELTPGNRLVLVTDRTVGDIVDITHPDVMKSVDKRVRGAFTERTKNRESWSWITDALLEMEMGRDTTIVALGGGVIGDLAGFVAATYMRGVPYVQVPTSLLAMVDASVGGKTGVDTPHGKNLVGAFHQPVAVIIDPLVLRTLPPEHLRGGFAEIIKHGVVADAAYFKEVREFLDGWSQEWSDDIDLGALTRIIQRSVEIKASVVARDERESGLRQVLNFGHTIAHALEAASTYEMLHSDAVAIGMIIEARVSERLGIAEAGTAQLIVDACSAAGLPVPVPAFAPSEVMRLTRADKKARAGRVRYALPSRIGAMAGAASGWSVEVPDEVLREALST